MEGFTNDEIAEKQDYASRTIERRLNSIRRKWAAITSSPKTTDLPRSVFIISRCKRRLAEADSAVIDGYFLIRE